MIIEILDLTQWLPTEPFVVTSFPVVGDLTFHEGLVGPTYTCVREDVHLTVLSRSVERRLIVPEPVPGAPLSFDHLRLNVLNAIMWKAYGFDTPRTIATLTCAVDPHPKIRIYPVTTYVPQSGVRSQTLGRYQIRLNAGNYELWLSNQPEVQQTDSNALRIGRFEATKQGTELALDSMPGQRPIEGRHPASCLQAVDDAFYELSGMSLESSIRQLHERANPDVAPAQNSTRGIGHANKSSPDGDRS